MKRILLISVSTENSWSLMHGPAFYPQRMFWNNSLPGQGGTVGMAGHRTTRTHPFCLIASLKPGRLATIKMPYGTYTYRMVKEVIVRPGNWNPFKHPGRYDPARLKAHEYLVFGACTPPHYATARRVTIWRLIHARLG